MSRDTTAGCIAQLFVPLIIIIGIAISDAYHNSEWSMIRDARKYSKISYYASYASKHPYGRYIQEAEDALYDLCANEKNFKEYIRCFPEGKHIDELKTKAQNAYNDALKERSIEKWKEFKKSQPEAFHFDADAQIQKLDDEIWASESAAWQMASNHNAQYYYNKYLEKHPQGKHSKQAIDNLVSLIMGSEHGAIPSMSRNSYTGYSYSTIEISNNTQYNLTLLYSGKESKRVVIAPHSTQKIRLTNGSYRIAASVDDYKVRPFAGSETIKGGNYNSTYYIQTSRY